MPRSRAAGSQKALEGTPARQQSRRARKTTSSTSLAVQDALRVVRRIRALESEAQFQRRVRRVLDALGFVVWVFPIMKRTIAGVPDLTFWHPSLPGRLFYWELKTEKGVIRREQRVSIAHLTTVAGVDARIVRPGDWEPLRDALLVLLKLDPAQPPAGR